MLSGRGEDRGQGHPTVCRKRPGRHAAFGKRRVGLDPGARGVVRMVPRAWAGCLIGGQWGRFALVVKAYAAAEVACKRVAGSGMRLAGCG